jgi:hypothetical protein
MALSFRVITALFVASAATAAPHIEQRVTSPAEVAVTECPHYWTADHGGPFPGTSIPLVGNLTNVPEYHDCQRLVTPALKYDSIFAVWVRDSIEDAYRRANEAPIVEGPLDFGEGTALEGRSGRRLEGDPSAVIAADGVRALVVGLIWTQGSYKPLGLTEGWACLVTRWRTKPASTEVDPLSYAGFVVPVAEARDCLTIHPLTAYGAKLAVTVMPRSRNDEVPPVARWDWDPKNKRQYVSMWCPSGWCEYHRPGYTTSRRWNTTAAPYSGANGMVVRQKGFYDEQMLASPTGDGPALARGPLIGTVFPEPGIASRTVDDYKGAWRPVGRVTLSDSSAAYHQKLLYLKDPDAPNGSDNVVSLCFKTGAPLPVTPLVSVANSPSVPIPGRVQQAGTALPIRFNPSSNATTLDCGGVGPAVVCGSDDAVGGHWYAKITNANNESRVFCVNFRKAPPGVKVLPVVRWRWIAKDEVLWFPCPGGCCEAES